MNNNWRDITLVDLNGALGSLIYDNDPIAANNLINYFHERFSDVGLDGCPQSAVGVLCEYMQHVFKKMLVDGYTAEQALGLKRRRGKHERADNTVRNHEITAHMMLSIRKGKKWLDARGDAASYFFDGDRGDKAAEKAYSENKQLFEYARFSDDDLEEIIKGVLRS